MTTEKGIEYQEEHLMREIFKAKFLTRQESLKRAAPIQRILSSPVIISMLVLYGLLFLFKFSRLSSIK
jgi:hypothetical protein